MPIAFIDARSIHSADTLYQNLFFTARHVYKDCSDVTSALTYFCEELLSSVAYAINLAR